MTIATPTTLAEWNALARALVIETRLVIDGQCRSAAAGELFVVINPADGTTVAEMACGTATDVELAVAAARRAWDDGRWRHMAPRLRMDIFRRWADLVEAHAAELALLETLSMGKPVNDALTIDLPETIVTIRYFGETIDKVAGAVTNSPQGAVHMIAREPLGIVGAISAQNHQCLRRSEQLL